MGTNALQAFLNVHTGTVNVIRATLSAVANGTSQNVSTMTSSGALLAAYIFPTTAQTSATVGVQKGTSTSMIEGTLAAAATTGAVAIGEAASSAYLFTVGDTIKLVTDGSYSGNITAEVILLVSYDD